MAVRLDPIEKAIADIAAGRPVVVVDDADRENEGDLIFAASVATPELVGFMVRYTSGYICVALPNEEADRLELPPMTAVNEDAHQTAYTVTVDAATGTTGISARSRCETMRRLADPAYGPADFTRPGHVVPLRARPGGVFARRGHTEAAVDLAVAAGLPPVGALCEIVSEEDPTDMARSPELRRFADKHGLAMVSIDDLVAWRRAQEDTSACVGASESATDKAATSQVAGVAHVAHTNLPTTRGDFRAVGYRGAVEHLALVRGEVRGARDVLVRVHSECLTGDVFGSRRCDCGPQLHEALRVIDEAGQGVVLYLRGQEGRGIGLGAKLRAYALQDCGLDTVDANLEQGLPVDAREYSDAVAMIRELGIASVRLMTNNPDKRRALEAAGIAVTECVPIVIPPNPHNIAYLETKRDRLGHTLPTANKWENAEHE